MTDIPSRQQLMETRLRKNLEITFLQIENQSAKHKGHAGDDGSGESHFLIIISSPDLESLSRLAQHRKLLEILGKDITSETHSISINIK